MKKRGPFHPKALLWWISAISLAVSTAVFFLLSEQAKIDPAIHARRMMFLLVSFIITGICLIVGTAGHWFYPNKR